MPSRRASTDHLSGILIPGGFGLRGTEGMIAAAKWAREKKVPFLGICLGFQVAVIEFARNVVGLSGSLSLEPPALLTALRGTLR